MSVEYMRDSKTSQKNSKQLLASFLSNAQTSLSRQVA